MAGAYAAWASRYLHDHGVTREAWGRIAVNGRSNALRNPLAALRTPITLEDYEAARMVREPLCMLDMDLPVDGADAFVLTSAERAKALPRGASGGECAHRARDAGWVLLQLTGRGASPRVRRSTAARAQ